MEFYSTSKTGIKYKREITSDYFKSTYQLEEMREDYETGVFLFVISKKYNVDKYEIRRKANYYGWNRLERKIDHTDVVNFIEYVQKNTCQGFASAIKTEKLIMDYLNRTTTKSDSISKRCFDLVFPTADKHCRSCGTLLKFTTYESGYGAYKGRKICKSCINSKYSDRSRISKSSQELFWAIHDKLNTTMPMWFAELNREKTVSTEKYQQKYPGINRHYYMLDFVYNNTHNIEYDGAPWHCNEKDIIRDAFLTKEKNFKVLRITHSQFVKNKTAAVEECLQFLKY